MQWDSARSHKGRWILYDVGEWICQLEAMHIRTVMGGSEKKLVIKLGSAPHWLFCMVDGSLGFLRMRQR